MRAFVVAILFGGLAISAANAQTPQANTPEALNNVYQCASIQDATQRLACYDGAVGRLREQESQGNIVAVDRGQVETIRRDSFGFSLPSLAQIMPRFGDSDAIDPSLERMELTIARISQRANGRYMFEMSNGQKWVQVEAQRASNVRVGDTVTVRRAALGSYMLSPAHGGAAHRIRREE